MACFLLTCLCAVALAPNANAAVFTFCLTRRTDARIVRLSHVYGDGVERQPDTADSRWGWPPVCSLFSAAFV